MSETDKIFAGPIPEIYDAYLVPLIFEAYATDLAHRVAQSDPTRVLETAAGSGVVTRALAPLLGKGARYVVSDLNQPMLARAASRQGPDERVAWRQADAVNLPFEDHGFDAVCCQFGVMFFADRIAGYREARRVLKPGGRFLFNVWDRIEENDFAHVVTEAVGAIFPDDPPRFLARTPHGYHDVGKIGDELRAAGFSAIQFATLQKTSDAPSARDPAIAYCQGHPVAQRDRSARPGGPGERHPARRRGDREGLWRRSGLRKDSGSRHRRASLTFARASRPKSQRRRGPETCMVGPDNVVQRRGRSRSMQLSIQSVEPAGAPEARGPNHKARLVIPPENVAEHSPFLLMAEDWFAPPAGFPTHPHRGIETVTFVLAGELDAWRPHRRIGAAQRGRRPVHDRRRRRHAQRNAGAERRADLAALAQSSRQAEARSRRGMTTRFGRMRLFIGAPASRRASTPAGSATSRFRSDRHGR